MGSPNSRATLKDYCLRKLGSPVIEINVDPDQIEDCIDDAIQFFQEFNTDGTKRIFLKHLITSTDVTNKYITLSSDVLYVSRMLPFSTSSLGQGSGMFSVQYQIHLNDIANMNNFIGSLAYYEQIGQYLSTMDMILTGTPQITFQRKENKLYIFGEWWDQELKAGDYVIIEAFQTISPTSATSIYNDIFIKNYTTQLIKARFGTNMSKFEGMQLPGGVTISGSQMSAEAASEIERLEDKLRSEYELPADMIVG